jgi:hypothetical protein
MQTTVTAVTAALTYAVDTGEKPVNETFGPGNIRRRNVGTDGRAPASSRSTATVSPSSTIRPRCRISSTPTN